MGAEEDAAEARKRRAEEGRGKADLQRLNMAASW